MFLHVCMWCEWGGGGVGAKVCAYFLFACRNGDHFCCEVVFCCCLRLLCDVHAPLVKVARREESQRFAKESGFSLLLSSNYCLDYGTCNRAQHCTEMHCHALLTHTSRMFLRIRLPCGNTHTHKHTRTHTHTHTHTYTHTHKQMHAHTHAHARIHTHARTHTIFRRFCPRTRMPCRP